MTRLLVLSFVVGFIVAIGDQIKPEVKIRLFRKCLDLATDMAIRAVLTFLWTEFGIDLRGFVRPPQNPEPLQIGLFEFLLFY